jgi:hypothetical protein
MGPVTKDPDPTRFESSSLRADDILIYLYDFCIVKQRSAYLLKGFKSKIWCAFITSKSLVVIGQGNTAKLCVNEQDKPLTVINEIYKIP